ncbi:MAG: methylated-DNA--[protein]-cysteine S-methyltransferase [Rubrivivax sp.]|nr:methylated-DNA--[protein]-cysteine S-methyltransferase [Rubrivivax sp.]
MTKTLDNVLVAQARLATPLGTLTAAATARGLAGLWFDGQKHHPGRLAAPVDAHNTFIAQARRELDAWFSDTPSRRRGFAVALDPQGTPFQREVWRLLRALRCGEQTHYGELARRLGRPQAARAVGAAVGRNPLAIVVPCHRVLGRDGSLTGYAGGLPRKQALLELEGGRTGASHGTGTGRAARGGRAASPTRAAAAPAAA